MKPELDTPVTQEQIVQVIKKLRKIKKQNACYVETLDGVDLQAIAVSNALYELANELLEILEK